jgi:hypothetical protein
VIESTCKTHRGMLFASTGFDGAVFSLLVLAALATWVLTSLARRGERQLAEHNDQRLRAWESSVRSWERLREERVGISEIDMMNGVAFERRLAAHFRAKGFSVATTPTSGDFGVDLLVGTLEGTMAVQAKRSAHPVGIQAVQEVQAGKSYYGCLKAAVITNATFTQNARQLAERAGVELWDRQRLVEELASVPSLPMPPRPPAPESEAPPAAPLQRLLFLALYAFSSARRTTLSSYPPPHQDAHRWAPRVPSDWTCERCGIPLPDSRRWCSPRCERLSRSSS